MSVVTKGNGFKSPKKYGGKAASYQQGQLVMRGDGYLSNSDQIVDRIHERTTTREYTENGRTVKTTTTTCTVHMAKPFSTSGIRYIAQDSGARFVGEPRSVSTFRLDNTVVSEPKIRDTNLTWAIPLPTPYDFPTGYLSSQHQESYNHTSYCPPQDKKNTSAGFAYEIDDEDENSYPFDVNNEYWDCFVCGRGFATNNSLHQHLRDTGHYRRGKGLARYDHEDTENWESEYDNAEDEDKDNDEDDEQEDDQWECFVCGRTFEAHFPLLQHLRNTGHYL